MIVRFGLLTRRAGLTPAAFRRHWRERHGPLAAKLPGLRGYQQNHVVEAAQRGISFARGDWAIDGLSQLWFDDVAAMRAAIGSDAYPPIAADSPAFLVRTQVLVAEPQVILAMPAESGPMIKRMSFIARRPGIDDARFRHEWLEVHGPLVRGFPGLVAYTQNHILDREAVPGTSCPREALPIDGLVEMWFRDEAALQAAFASPAGQETMRHAQTFLGEITTFLVEPVRIV
ncbi:uncharacterized protein (TIGR02118 family) [Humitalea rosea]|uniref:Uncharacterized protein (TIGR02118 family) n=1 Tax=Humitalea rosea TaxID=990373 RepID=A0A2W7HZ48_9PROT|nr:EthD family reductase [Humitalea rosea]PZW37741.1 uncharacterized protein (TIGR02118 family) [Humitalea rosea]